jgi:hypothetical protein
MVKEIALAKANANFKLKFSIRQPLKGKDYEEIKG